MQWGRGVNPTIDLRMNLAKFWRAWKRDFLPLLGVYPPLPGVYPPSMALVDYWSHLVLGFTPLPGGLPFVVWGLPLWLGEASGA